jgi:hypothetical protein
MTPRIERAIDVFLDAINNGTLAAKTCVACAVGNLVAHGYGAKIEVKNERFYCEAPNTAWVDVFCTRFGRQLYYPQYLKYDNVKENIAVTEFTLEELMKIEYTFEQNTKIHNLQYDLHSKEKVRADQIRGLEAVVKVILEFDNCKDSVKEVFTSKAELIPC